MTDSSPCVCADAVKGAHTKEEHVDGMYSRCGICGGPGHYTSAHQRWASDSGWSPPRVMQGRRMCGICGEKSHRTKDHECSQCHEKGDHRGICCPHTVRLSFDFRAGKFIE